MSWKLVRHRTVDSTNDEAKALIAEGAAPWTVVMAEEQLAGKGRFGRSWTSPPGGLYASICVREELERIPLLTMAASLAVVQALEIWDLSTAVKWPNDVQVGGSKVAGVLVEGLVGPEGYWAVVGIGVNSDLPLAKLSSELTGQATTLREELGTAIDNEDLLSRLLKGFRAYADQLDSPEGLLQAYRDRCSTLKRDVVVETGEGVVRGRAIRIDASGVLVVRTSSGDEVEVASGTLRPA